MFDTTCADTRRMQYPLPVAGVPADKCLDCASQVGTVTWEEHCVECGQPACFRMCRMFERSFDGKCRRFDYGIVPIKSEGKVLFACAFRKWAKLEGVFSGGIVTRRQEARIARFDRYASFVMQRINRLMSFVPGRIGAITIYRRLKRWAGQFVHRNSDATVSGIVLRGCASRQVELHFSVIQNEEVVHEGVFALDEAWKTFKAAFRPVGAGTRFLLFATDDSPFEAVFETLEILPVPIQESVPMKTDQPAKGGTSPAPFVKCLAWDLDNTLWKGVLTEDGPDGIVVRDEAVALIRELDSRGILNTICSKNDYEPTWAILKRLGLADYFVFPTINWNPKSINLRASAKAINIGLDSFAFIDDSPFERGEVGESLPMVRVFKNTEILDLAGRPEFNPPVSAEGAKRRLSYQREMWRVTAAEAFEGDYQEFLKSCEIVLTLFPLRTAERPVRERCYELVQRTNQLTLAGRRYEPASFDALVERADVATYGIRCQDRFGDYGVVGVAIVRHYGETATIEEFVMSCRVAKKQCEYAVVHALSKRAAEKGAKMFAACIVMTGRNGALISAFDEMPFKKTLLDAKRVNYEMTLAGSRLPEAVNRVEFV